MMCLQEQGIDDGEDGRSDGLNDGASMCWLFEVSRRGWQAVDTKQLE